jgi:hypothetical protein
MPAWLQSAATSSGRESDMVPREAPHIDPATASRRDDDSLSARRSPSRCHAGSGEHGRTDRVENQCNRAQGAAAYHGDNLDGMAQLSRARPQRCNRLAVWRRGARDGESFCCQWPEGDAAGNHRRDHERSRPDPRIRPGFKERFSDRSRRTSARSTQSRLRSVGRLRFRLRWEVWKPTCE